MLLFLVSFSFGQEKKIEEKKSELSNIHQQITKLENQIKQKAEKEKKTYSTLSNLDQQKFLLNKLINKLKAEEKAKQTEIIESRNEISNLVKNIKALKENYAKYIVWIYKYGKPNKLSIIVDASSFEQAVLRYKYLQKFTEKRKEDLDELKNNIDRLEKVKAQLEREKKEKELLARQKEDEGRALTEKMKESQKLILAIKEDKTQLKNEIEAKKQSEQKIKDLIAKLIEEQKRKEAERLARLKSNAAKNNSGPNAEYDVDLSTSGFTSFSSLKGHLNWPVNKATIIRQFGENRNKKLNTVTLNYGVDMKVYSDMDVKAVADGVVSAIDWIPGYGSVVIVTHKGDYRTVYSHMGEIYVNEGDKLKTGSLIGKVGESLEGNILHFEIWNSRDHQDPQIWLANR
ncbi:MAG TPA: peptidoglycan DD-metalloendopeptidase family protein [Ignavibacteriaceae bacterium]|nr:peptidoglycan DD-metalloendopeptidase family protein [Ignavibacteriaceae bacterium]